MWNPLNLINTVVDGVKTYATNKQELKREAQAQKVSLIQSKDSHNHSWEIAALSGEGGDVFFIRIGLFILVNVGIVITVVNPAAGVAIWKALTLVPNWIIGLNVSMAGWAYGNAPVKAVAAGLIGSVLKFPGKQGSQVNKDNKENS